MGDTKQPNVDQDGKMINPHNPDFITKVPWYLGNHGPTLKHHSIQKNDHELSLAETDSLIAQKLRAKSEAQKSSAKTVYKKGACKNCGAITHKEKDCLERPRSSKKAAWKSGLDIAPNDIDFEFSQHGKLSYAAKRDQWKGYDTNEYKDVIERYERLEEERKLSTTEKNTQSSIRNKEASAGEESDILDSDDEGQDESKEFLARDEEIRDFQGTMAPQGGVGGAGMRQTVRNLRLREDTPKYLRNLSLESAFYDPKSRSMRANPYPNSNPEDVPFAGDNFVRYSGDAVKLAQNQVLCWEMQARGESVDVISNPSQAELVQKQFVEKKKIMEDSKKKAILEKYLDGKNNEQLDPRLKLGQTEVYVEYTKDGRLANAPSTNTVTKSKYEEDVFMNNHTSVWGSYYDRMKANWGYACCHSLMRNSYCTGKKGIEASKSTQFTGLPKNVSSNSSSIVPDLKQKHDEESTPSDSQKRVYKSVEVTEAELESYKRKKISHDDPMVKFLVHQGDI